MNLDSLNLIYIWLLTMLIILWVMKYLAFLI